MKKGVYRVDSIEEFDEKETDQANGTLISWSPDKEPFKNQNSVSAEIIQSKLENFIKYIFHCISKMNCRFVSILSHNRARATGWF